MAVATIKLVRYKDSAMTAAIFYWVLINKPTEKVGPPYFTSKEDAEAWASANGYKYK